jgi:hypothetical protein
MSRGRALTLTLCKRAKGGWRPYPQAKGSVRPTVLGTEGVGHGDSSLKFVFSEACQHNYHLPIPALSC